MRVRADALQEMMASAEDFLFEKAKSAPHNRMRSRVAINNTLQNFVQTLSV
jgi:hypothetical protein